MGSCEGQHVLSAIDSLPDIPFPLLLGVLALRVTLSKRGWQVPADGAKLNCDISADSNAQWLPSSCPSMSTEGLKVWDFEILRQSSADEPRDLRRTYSSSSTSTLPSTPRMLTFSTIGSPNRGLPGLHLLQLWGPQAVDLIYFLHELGFTLPSYPAKYQGGARVLARKPLPPGCELHPAYRHASSPEVYLNITGVGISRPKGISGRIK
jgi:hypothetical protein